MKKTILLVTMVLGIIALTSMAFAGVPYVLPSGGGVNTGQYHSYDGLLCTDCHTLHNSEGGAAIGEPGYSGTANRELLKRGDWTDMCLSCHKQGQNTSSTAALDGVENSGWVAPIVMTLDGVDPVNISMPAGDFYYSNADPKKGHNPAYTKGSLTTPTSLFMAADSTLGSTPPGGTITDGEWSCHSCHGMHSRFSGSYTAWRQLKRTVNGIKQSGCDQTRANGADSTYQDCSVATTDTGYEAIKSNSRGFYGSDLNYKNTRADGNPLEGADLFADESDTNKNVYRGGFSSFCDTCHGSNFHGGNGETRTANNSETRVNGAWVRHPTNVVMNEAGSKYGITTYKATVVNQQSTNPNPVGYDWKYPLVQPDADFTVKSAVASYTDAATAIGTSRITCLTCHKAHASQFDNMTRWNTNAQSFIANGVTDHTGGVDQIAGDNPAYGCGKCHQKGGTKAFKKAF